MLTSQTLHTSFQVSRAGYVTSLSDAFHQQRGQFRFLKERTLRLQKNWHEKKPFENIFF